MSLVNGNTRMQPSAGYPPPVMSDGIEPITPSFPPTVALYIGLGIAQDGTGKEKYQWLKLAAPVLAWNGKMESVMRLPILDMLMVPATAVPVGNMGCHVPVTVTAWCSEIVSRSPEDTNELPGLKLLACT